MMGHILPLLPTILVAGLVACLIGFPISVAFWQAHRDRRRVMAQGTSTEALVSEIRENRDRGGRRIRFSFQPEGASSRKEIPQKTTRDALELAHIGVGSSVRAHYLPRWPGGAFIPDLVIAERATEIPNADSAVGEPSERPSVHFVSYVALANSAWSKRSRWNGSGDIAITPSTVRLTTMRPRPFWFPRRLTLELARDRVVNVEAYEAMVQLEVPGEMIQFRTVNAAEALAIAGELPQSRTPKFVPRMADRGEFKARLLAVTPVAPVTPTLIAANVGAFVIAVYLGAGFLVPNPEVLIRMGSDYTPLTEGGQWWRLLTSIFLHFGFLHLAVNMWALWVFGILTERLYGSARYVLIYLTAGVAGSLASFVWHPLVNGAGASGAIFGVLGALLAFFIRAPAGVPKSVISVQRNSAAIFIAYSLLNAARLRGVDNAAHLGGLGIGFVLGLLLVRPLDVARSERSWAGQWSAALGAIIVGALLVRHAIADGTLHPRTLLDERGYPIPLTALGPPLRSVAGVTLGMTATELRRTYGSPLRTLGANYWIYDSIRQAHDGLLDVYFAPGASESSRRVIGVLFTPGGDAVPSDMPNLLGLTREELARRFGEPVREGKRTAQGSFLEFRNGVVVLVGGDKTYEYGVYALP